MRKFILSFLMVAVIGSCAYHDVEDIATSKTSSNRISVEEAKRNVIKFVSSINRQNATRGAVPHTLEIASVLPVTSVVTPKTRSQAGTAAVEDTLFYVVKFAGENSGFALAASTKKSVPVYAYVEEGEYTDFVANNGTATNPGFEGFLGALYEYTTQGDDPHEVDSSRFDENGNVKYDETIVLKTPLLVTKWGQGAPYNLKCEGNLAGCVPVALAQIWTHLGRLANVSWTDGLNSGGSQLDWGAIRSMSQAYPGKSLNFISNVNENDTVRQIASLIRFMGCNSNASYGKDGTGADSEYAIKEVKKMGVNVDGLRDFDDFAVVNHLRSNHIVFMRGDGRYYHVGLVFRKYVDGHAWVVDGFLDRYEAGNRYIYLHCNWGWNGDQNGYFYSKILNTEEKRYEDDGKKTRTNFRYNLKTAAIWNG